MPVTVSSNDAGWDIPKRYLRLTLYRGRNTVRTFNTLTEDMYVKFNTTDAVSGALTEANIVIGGMLVQNMFNVATSTTQWRKDWIQHRLVIEAGYYNHHSVIYDGIVVSAKPNLESANFTLSLKCITGFETITEPRSYSFPGTVSVTMIAAKLAKDHGLAFVNGITDAVPTISDFTVTQQNLPAIMRTISNAVPVNMYVSGGRLYLQKQNEPIAGLPTLSIRSQDIIGSPEPTDTGCIVNVRMKPQARTGCPVSLNSIRYPQMNTIHFFLDVMSHVGDTCGRDWYTRLVLTKQGLGFLKNAE